ncbi:hypothetical protein SCAR479_09697 [Seiridium cardinale]|uniref:Carboxylic ester hydrolase n=1 Tax=Seiridium cardinale TaxID=138064 RepID=A0ABR2XIB5_9PEZI
MTAPEGLASLCQNSTFATPEVPGVAITLIIAETVHKFSGEAPCILHPFRPGRPHKRQGLYARLFTSMEPAFPSRWRRRLDCRQRESPGRSTHREESRQVLLRRGPGVQLLVWLLAQPYPDIYDGIAASTPAVHWAHQAGATFWPQLVVNDFLNGTKPQDCEVDEMAAKAIEICDPLDGVTDGLISDMESCDRTFNTFDHVGDTFVRASTGVETNLSYQAALFPKYTWEGHLHTLLLGEWSRLFVEKNSTFDHNTITLQHIIGASDSDLREFKPHGGKMLTFHGMSDRYVATESVEACFDAVSSTTEDVNDYYRLFLGPGVYHCSCVPDGKPTALLFQL